MTIAITEFQVRRDDCAATRFVEETVDPARLEPGQVLLSIDKFSFSTNNITYVGLGDQLRYWDYFPAGEGWGKPPVWGYATVVASQLEEIPVGERVFGYFPMASHLLVEPVGVRPERFVDGAPHRAALAEQLDFARTYNSYLRLSHDPGYRPETEDLDILFRPLFFTSFLLADFVVDHDLFGADQIVITSASSKTSYSAAFELQRLFADRSPRPSVIGLTSPAQLEFVDGLGCYDQLLPYDDAGQIDSAVAAVVLDVAGNPAVSKALIDHFGDSLRHFAVVGVSHLGDGSPGGPPLSDRAEFFFAATQNLKRGREWGPEGLARRYAEAWIHFLPHAQGAVAFQHHGSRSGIEGTYRSLLNGGVSARQGFILSLKDAAD